MKFTKMESQTMILLMILLLFNVFCKGSNDSDEKIQKTYENLFQANRNKRLRVLLEKQENYQKIRDKSLSKPIRVTFDDSELYKSPQKNENPLNSIQIENVKRVLNDIKIFLAGFIKVIPEKQNLKFRNQSPRKQKSKPICKDVEVSQKDIDIGIDNSDLHIYINHKNITGQTLALASDCQFGYKPGYIRPSFGRIKYNSNKLINGELNPQQYQKLFQTTLHEIFHILGFSKHHFNKKFKGQIISQNIRGFQTTILSTPNMKRLAQNYYDCPSLRGMQLENQGSRSSIGSHWEETVLAEDLMISVIKSGIQSISIFTVKLLQDLGYYSDVNENYVTPMYWGKGQGCGFYNNACNDTKKYREFYYPGSNQTNECSFQNSGEGDSITSQNKDRCQTVKVFKEKNCQNIQDYNVSIKLNTSSFSEKSMCFKSSLIDNNGEKPKSKEMKTYEAGCHEMKCLESNNEKVIQVMFKDNIVECKQEDAGKDKEILLEGNKLGTLRCPDDYEQFCQRRLCKNDCSAHGFCLNGECTCSPGYTLENCSHKCPSNQYAEINQDGQIICVSRCSKGTFANPNNTCKASCPSSYFATKEGKCEPCDFSCKQCIGPTRNECTACQVFSILKGNTCEEVPPV